MKKALFFIFIAFTSGVANAYEINQTVTLKRAPWNKQVFFSEPQLRVGYDSVRLRDGSILTQDDCFINENSSGQITEIEDIKSLNACYYSAKAYMVSFKDSKTNSSCDVKFRANLDICGGPTQPTRSNWIFE